MRGCDVRRVAIKFQNIIRYSATIVIFIICHKVSRGCLIILDRPSLNASS